MFKQKHRKIGGQETYNMKSLGGTVIIRGLLTHEAAGIAAAVKGRLSSDREQRAAFLVLALKNGVVKPEMSEVEVMDFVLEHQDDAKKLARRIQTLTEGNVKDQLHLTR
jgi:hypothetical protein